MENINITKISSKGQIVIPFDMRGNLREGDKLVVLKNKNQIILKKMEDFSKNLEEDLEFAKRTEEAFKRIDSGEFNQVDSDFLEKEMMKW